MTKAVKLEITQEMKDKVKAECTEILRMLQATNGLMFHSFVMQKKPTSFGIDDKGNSCLLFQKLELDEETVDIKITLNYSEDLYEIDIVNFNMQNVYRRDSLYWEDVWDYIYDFRKSEPECKFNDMADKVGRLHLKNTLVADMSEEQKETLARAVRYCTVAKQLTPDRIRVKDIVSNNSFELVFDGEFSRDSIDNISEVRFKSIPSWCQTNRSLLSVRNYNLLFLKGF